MAGEHLPFANYKELIEKISRLCGDGCTGSLLIISDINCFARVVIVAGNIIYVEYRLKKGVAAIPLFLEIEHGTLDFKDGRIISHEAYPLPSTPDLLVQLGSQAPLSPRASQVSAAKVSWADTEAFKIIEDQLIDVLGPMASLIWEEHWTRAGGAAANIDLVHLINSVATEIDDPEKAAQFRSHVHSMLEIHHF